jgi:hypothetical protein
MENYPSASFLGLFSGDTVLYDWFNLALGDFIAYLYLITDRAIDNDLSGVTACGFMYI